MSEDISDTGPDAAAKDQLKKKQKLALRKKIATLDKAIADSLADTQYTKKKKERAARRKKLALWAGGAALFALFVYAIFMKSKAGIQYGICKVFIETRVEYPRELRYTAVYLSPNKVRVWYVTHDSFGQKPIERMDCFFGYDPNGQLYLQKAEINRGQIDPRAVETFNYAIPAILAYPPDLNYPKGLPEDLKSFQKAN